MLESDRGGEVLILVSQYDGRVNNSYRFKHNSRDNADVTIITAE